MALRRRVGVFSLELWVTVALVLVLIVLFMRSFNSTYDEVEQLKATRLAASMEGALRQVHTGWLANNQPGIWTIDTGNAFIMSKQGYPVAVAGESGIDRTEGCVRVLQLLAGDALLGQTNGWPRLAAAADDGRCRYQYLFEAGHRFELQFDTVSGRVVVL